MIAFEQLCHRLYGYAGLEHARGATDSQIVEVERVLGVKLPDDYVLFLREFGWISLEGLELYGVGDGVPAPWELVSSTIRERQLAEPAIPNILIPVMNDGAGNHYCLDMSRFSGGQCPVVFWDHEDRRGTQQVPETVANSFVEWLWKQLDELETYDADSDDGP